MDISCFMKRRSASSNSILSLYGVQSPGRGRLLSGSGGGGEVLLGKSLSNLSHEVTTTVHG